MVYHLSPQQLLACWRLAQGLTWPMFSLFCWKTEGYRFRLCLFPEVQARQATWDGVFELVRDTFPEAWPKVAPHIHVRVLFLIALLLIQILT